ncbi:MAG: hypothetical protein QXM32_05045 [Nitrososphaerota archaeon]
MEKEYKVKLIEKDERDREYVIVEVNGEKVKVEAIHRKEVEEILLDKTHGEVGIHLGKIWFNNNEEKAKAVYRLLLYFNAPPIYSGGDAVCHFYLRYKNYQFKLVDMINRSLDIDYDYYLPLEEYFIKYRDATSEERSKFKEKIKPPENIVNEFISIIEYLVKNPYIYIDQDGNEVYI